MTLCEWVSEWVNYILAAILTFPMVFRGNTFYNWNSVFSVRHSLRMKNGWTSCIYYKVIQLESSTPINYSSTEFVLIVKKKIWKMPWSSAWLRPRYAHSTFILNTSYAIQTKYLLIARLLRTRHKFKYMRIFLNFEQFFFCLLLWWCFENAAANFKWRAVEADVIVNNHVLHKIGVD